MKYFTKEEATRIIRNSGLSLCCTFDDNPNLQAAQALHEAVLELGNQPIYVASLGFVLGRATGIREERARMSAMKDGHDVSKGRIYEEIKCVLRRNIDNEEYLRKVLSRALILEELFQKEAKA